MTQAQRAYQSLIVAGLVTMAIITLVYVFMKMQLKQPANPAATPTASVMQGSDTTSASGSPESAAPTAETVNITLTSSGFDPKEVTVTKGSTVVWTNKSGQSATVNSADHPTHLLYPALNLGEFADGQTLQLMFNDAGTFGYHNHYNPSVYGKIIVK